MPDRFDFRPWARRLKFFRFVRTGHPNDGDELRVALRCSTQGESNELQKSLRGMDGLIEGMRPDVRFNPPVFELTVYGNNKEDPYSIGERDCELAIRVEALLEPLRHRIIDPPEDSSRCLCPKYHPDYFAALDSLEPAPSQAVAAREATSAFDEELRRNWVSSALLEALHRAYADDAATPSSWLTSVLQRMQDSIQQGHTLLVDERLSTSNELLGWVRWHFPKKAEDIWVREFHEQLRSRKTVTRDMLHHLQQLHATGQPEAQGKVDSMLRIIQDTLQQSGAVSVHGKQDRVLRTQVEFYTWAAEHFPPASPK
jgi:hypothetical protein